MHTRARKTTRRGLKQMHTELIRSMQSREKSKFQWVGVEAS